MDDALHVAVGDTSQHLIQEFLDFKWLHHLGSQTLHVGSQVLIEVFEDQVKLLLVNDHVFESG